jgi:hypothetical protein
MGVTLDTQLTSLPQINQVRKKVAERLGVVSIRIGLLLYKQLICPGMEYACFICKLAADTRIKKKGVHQFKCFALPPLHLGT